MRHPGGRGQRSAVSATSSRTASTASWSRVTTRRPRRSHAAGAGAIRSPASGSAGAPRGRRCASRGTRRPTRSSALPRAHPRLIVRGRAALTSANAVAGGSAPDTRRTCHSLFRGAHLQLCMLTCGNVELTTLGAVGIFRLAPSSRCESKRGVGPDTGGAARPIRVSRDGRPSGRTAAEPPGAPQGEPGGRWQGTPQGGPQRPRAGADTSRRTEVAWGTRAREADGGWELRFPASRRSLGFFLSRVPPCPADPSPAPAVARGVPLAAWQGPPRSVPRAGHGPRPPEMRPSAASGSSRRRCATSPSTATGADAWRTSRPRSGSPRAPSSWTSARRRGCSSPPTSARSPRSPRGWTRRRRSSPRASGRSSSGGSSARRSS